MRAHCLEQYSAAAAAELSRMEAAFYLQVLIHRAERLLSLPSHQDTAVGCSPCNFLGAFLGNDQVINLKHTFYPMFAFMDGNTSDCLISISSAIMI